MDNVVEAMDKYKNRNIELVGTTSLLHSTYSTTTFCPCN